MYISEGQIKAVVKTLKDNEYKLSDGYKYYYSYDKDYNFRFEDMSREEACNFTVDSVLEEVALEIITNLNIEIYEKGI